MRALAAVGRLYLQLRRYPAEALESLCHSVRADELDGRRAPLLPRSNTGLAVAWRPRPTLCVWRHNVMARAANCRVPCARHRHATGALWLCASHVRNKPAAPWSPEAARRVLSAMLAAVRAPGAAACAARSPGARLATNPLFPFARLRVGRTRALRASGAGRAPAARLGDCGRRGAVLGPRVGRGWQGCGPGRGAVHCSYGSRDGVAVDSAAGGLREHGRGVGLAATEHAACGAGRRVRGEPAGQVCGALPVPLAGRHSNCRTSGF